MFLDSAIRDWVLVPIMFVMILVGVLRQNVTLLMASKPKLNLKGVRESQALMKCRLLRVAGAQIPSSGFVLRREVIGAKIEANEYLKNPNQKGAPNPMDPAGMEMMMDGMYKNMAMIIPQTLIMGWINYFFSGFVLIKIPFPLTLRFKTMLQRGIETSDMDVAWVSSLSWYFINLFGLSKVFSLILGDGNAADGLQDMQQFGGAAAMNQAPQDMQKVFQSEKESLDIISHVWDLEDVENRLLVRAGKMSASKSSSQKKNE